jgi:flagellar biosynthesis/type III secretory pathway M-ring protein FliF/YscJ
MEFLKNQFSRVQEQVSQLTASQKMLAGALVIITVMSLYYWTTFAGRAEMEVLFDQPMAADQMAQALGTLRSSGITAQAAGDRLHVAADKKIEALAVLGSALLLPSDTKNAIDELVGKINPWMSHSLEDRMFLHAKEMVLAQALRNWPQVRHAVVVIDATRERGPGGAEPSASVSVMLKGGTAGDQRLANNIGEFISGALSSLHRSRVKVHINDRGFTLRDKDEQSPAASAEELLAQVQSYEKHYAEKLRDQFGFIEGVFVTVNCKVNNERSEKTVETADPKNVIQKPVRDTTSTEENNSNRKDGGEPGVGANTGLAVDSTNSGEKNTGTIEKSATEFLVFVPKTNVKTINNGGDPTLMGVSVLFPRSQFIQMYKRRTNSDKEPDATVLQAFVDEQLRSMRAVVKSCVGVLPDEAVSVAEYVDALPAGGATTVAAAAPMSLMFTDHAKEIALGALALVSLFMVSNMVKKSSGPRPAPAMAMAMAHGAAPRGPSPLQGREEAVGEAMEGDPLMDGMELDEESAKAQQTLNQVSAMVEENPEGAANLVKRWMNRS